MSIIGGAVLAGVGALLAISGRSAQKSSEDLAAKTKLISTEGDLKISVGYDFVDLIGKVDAERPVRLQTDETQQAVFVRRATKRVYEEKVTTTNQQGKTQVRWDKKTDTMEEQEFYGADVFVKVGDTKVRVEGTPNVPSPCSMFRRDVFSHNPRERSSGADNDRITLGYEYTECGVVAPSLAVVSGRLEDTGSGYRIVRPQSGDDFEFCISGDGNRARLLRDAKTYRTLAITGYVFTGLGVALAAGGFMRRSN